MIFTFPLKFGPVEGQELHNHWHPPDVQAQLGLQGVPWAFSLGFWGPGLVSARKFVLSDCFFLVSDCSGFSRPEAGWNQRRPIWNQKKPIWKQLRTPEPPAESPEGPLKPNPLKPNWEFPFWEVPLGNFQSGIWLRFSLGFWNIKNYKNCSRSGSKIVIVKRPA